MARTKKRTQPGAAASDQVKEGKQMITLAIVTAAVLLTAFLAGAIAATIVLLRAGIVREESDKTLMGRPRTRASAVTRRIVDLRTQPIRR